MYFGTVSVENELHTHWKLHEVSDEHERKILKLYFPLCSRMIGK